MWIRWIFIRSTLSIISILFARSYVPIISRSAGSVISPSSSMGAIPIMPVKGGNQQDHGCKREGCDDGNIYALVMSVIFAIIGIPC